MSNNSGSSSSAGRGVVFDPSLLQPIVRSKRTPIACTECRRRQVKCSGTTPRCDRCTKKNIECAYVPLSEQRGSGGSISRSGTPLAGGSAGQAYPHASTHAGRGVANAPAGWQAGQGGTSSYPAPQGWRPQSPAPTAYGTQVNQGYTGVPMAYPQGYAQQSQGQAAYTQGGTTQGGVELYGQGYAQQQSYAGGTSYNAYGHALPATDPRYAAYQTQLAAMSGEQQSAAYAGQFAQEQQLYFDPNTGAMVSADVASQWANNSNAGFQGQPYSGHN